ARANVSEIVLAKIYRLRYIALTLLMRYVGIWVALTTMKTIRMLVVLLFLAAVMQALAGTATFEAQPSPSPADENSHDLFDYEMDYTLNSNFYDDHGKFGNGDSLYNDFSYAHRFLITGKWYFRAGVEYERFDFNGTNNGLPDHLQTVHALLALEYVVHDHAGAGIEIDPGPYFQEILPAIQSTFPGKCSSVSRSRKIKSSGSSASVVAS